MASDVSARVRQYRATSGLIRVEVQVPTTEAATAIRQFAQQLRNRKAPVCAIAPAISAESSRENLESLLDQISPDALPSLHLFASSLVKAGTPALLERGARIAANFADAVKAQSLTVSAPVHGEAG